MPGLAGVLRNDDQQTRTIALPDGDWLVERLIAEGPSSSTTTASMTPGRSRSGASTDRLTVTTVGADPSEIHWAPSFEPTPGATEGDTTTALTGFYQACLEKIAMELGAEAVPRWHDSAPAVSGLHLPARFGSVLQRRHLRATARRPPGRQHQVLPGRLVRRTRRCREEHRVVNELPPKGTTTAPGIRRVVTPLATAQLPRGVFRPSFGP